MIAGFYSLDYISFGVPFRLSSDSHETLQKMQQCLPLGAQIFVAAGGDARDFTVARGPDAKTYRLLVDNETVAEDEALGPILDRLAGDLMVHVANHATGRVFVHAGVVGWKGYALILPGTSFAGKTTLVAELVRAGAIYYSDEYAVFDESGLVHPYARDLQMREAGGWEQRSVSVRDLDGETGAQALSVSHVVFTEFVEGGLWNPLQVSPGSAVLEMMRHAIPVQRTPARVMATLAKVMETAVAIRTERGDASDAARILLTALNDSLSR